MNNRSSLSRNLMAIALLGAFGAAGAQADTPAEAATQGAPQATPQQAERTPAPRFEWRDPWAALHADMMRMQAQMDQMFNGALSDVNAGGVGNVQQSEPMVTLEEQGDSYVVKAEIPGASEGDINVKLDGRLLSISSQSQGGEQQTAENGQVIQQESYASSFQQAFTLPGPVEATGMQTRFRDGVLTVTLPKLTS